MLNGIKNRNFTKEKEKELKMLRLKIRSIGTQKEVAVIFGVSAVTVTRWIKGDADIKKVYLDRIDELYKKAIGDYA